MPTLGYGANTLLHIENRRQHAAEICTSSDEATNQDDQNQDRQNELEIWL